MVNCCEAVAAKGRAGELLAGWHAAKQARLIVASKLVDRLISGPVGQTTTSWQVDKLTSGQGRQGSKGAA
jgi:hypothetical protein